MDMEVGLVQYMKIDGGIRTAESPSIPNTCEAYGEPAN